MEQILPKPCTDIQRADFIVYWNHNRGYDITETETEIIASEHIIPQSDLQEQMRQLRNQYLKDYVDTRQLPLYWADASETERQQTTEYRRYLLDYPQGAKWWANPPKTWEEYYG